jgi:hypothetical protein
MGYDRHRCVAAMKRAGVCESTRNAWLAESVPSRLAESCALLALAHVAVDHQPAVWRVGSLFSGARDALSAGFMDAGCAVDLAFAAESDPDRLRVLFMHRAPRNEYASAKEASVRCPCVDALVASPPCDLDEQPPGQAFLQRAQRAHEQAARGDGGCSLFCAVQSHRGKVRQHERGAARAMDLRLYPCVVPRVAWEERG